MFFNAVKLTYDASPQRLRDAIAAVITTVPHTETALSQWTVVPLKDTEPGGKCDNWTDTVAATVGGEVVYNGRWVAKVEDSDLRGALLSIFMSIPFAQATRRGEREERRWAIAMSFVNNLSVLELIKTIEPGYITLPEGSLIDETFAGLLTEEVYDRLGERYTFTSEDA